MSPSMLVSPMLNISLEAADKLSMGVSKELTSHNSRGSTIPSKKNLHSFY
jgi:hypothetical protein